MEAWPSKKWNDGAVRDVKEERRARGELRVLIPALGRPDLVPMPLIADWLGRNLPGLARGLAPQGQWAAG